MFNEDEYEEVLLHLLKLQSYLFVNYFKKYKFGKFSRILEVFSILPPKLRNIVLDKLYYIDSWIDDLCDLTWDQVVEKLSEDKTL